jgi:hypothetical protein
MPQYSGCFSVVMASTKDFCNNCQPRFAVFSFARTVCDLETLPQQSLFNGADAILWQLLKLGKSRACTLTAKKFSSSALLPAPQGRENMTGLPTSACSSSPAQPHSRAQQSDGAVMLATKTARSKT